MLSLGVFGRSKKKDEKRVPIHPKQIDWIDPVIRKHMFFETSYGAPFGIDDSSISSKLGGVMARKELLNKCDIALLAKPTLEDFKEMKEGTIHWGWPHCVQQTEVTQSAIDKKLTLIAWEAMHSWSVEGKWQGHTFSTNNEIAGYAGVLHSMNLMGIDGNYGQPLKAVVISYGSVSHGAIHGLKTRGVKNISVCTDPQSVPPEGQLEGVRYYHLKSDPSGKLMASDKSGLSTPLIELLSEADIIVNGILQDTDIPLMFVQNDEVNKLNPGTLIVDVSCDEGMGFPFAIPTSFENPILQFDKIHYYAVDHIPSYLWNAASWEISKSIIPYLPIVVNGPGEWEKNETIRRAIEIKEGKILNTKILSFQNRSDKFPYPIAVE
jgi:alanine dehydrogenase